MVGAQGPPKPPDRPRHLPVTRGPIVCGADGQGLRGPLRSVAVLAGEIVGDRFDAIVGQEDYVHGKPDPEPFLTAAKKLGVDASKCLVFEDADAGIASAKAAKMQWVRVDRAPTVAITL